MHSNADITFQMNTSNAYCNLIIQTGSDDSADVDLSNNEKLVTEMLKKYLELLPENLRRSEASKQVKERGNDGMISI